MEKFIPIRLLNAEPLPGSLPPGIYCYGVALYFVGLNGELETWMMPSHWPRTLDTYGRETPSGEFVPWRRVYELIAIGAAPRMAAEFLARELHMPPVNINIDYERDRPAPAGGYAEGAMAQEASRPGQIRRG